MTDELRVSLFSGQGRGGDEAKRSWMGIYYVDSYSSYRESSTIVSYKLSSQTITEFPFSSSSLQSNELMIGATAPIIAS